VTRFPQTTLIGPMGEERPGDQWQTPAETTVFEAMTRGVRIRVSTVMLDTVGQQDAQGNGTPMFSYSVGLYSG
jgi:hypothetical protein